MWISINYCPIFEPLLKYHKMYLMDAPWWHSDYICCSFVNRENQACDRIFFQFYVNEVQYISTGSIKLRIYVLTTGCGQRTPSSAFITYSCHWNWPRNKQNIDYICMAIVCHWCNLMYKTLDFKNIVVPVADILYVWCGFLLVW